MDMIIVASLILLAVVIGAAYKGLKNKQQADSALRRRAVFNSHEQITFTRLKEILPEANILAHVSFDALLTTKYLHTRRKYQQMFANFVVLDKDYKVLAVIALDDINAIKRSNQNTYEDALLQSAGYRVIRYMGIPEYQDLREDFLTEFSEMSHSQMLGEHVLGKFDLYSNRAYSYAKNACLNMHFLVHSKFSIELILV